MDKIKELINKHRDVIPYLFFGVCTTLVNMVVYWLMAHAAHAGTMVSTVIAWVAAVLFAYLTNRKWVFHSEAKGAAEIAKEAGYFFACRLGTGVLDWVCMYVFVDLLRFNDVVIKFLANVLVIVLNYVFSKFVIFKKKR